MHVFFHAPASSSRPHLGSLPAASRRVTRSTTTPYMHDACMHYWPRCACMGWVDDGCVHLGAHAPCVPAKEAVRIQLLGYSRLARTCMRGTAWLSLASRHGSARECEAAGAISATNQSIILELMLLGRNGGSGSHCITRGFLTPTGSASVTR